MKIKIEKYSREIPSITFDFLTKNHFVIWFNTYDLFSKYFPKTYFCNYSYLYNKELIPSSEILMEKFNAYYDNPFLFKNKEDAEKFLKYLEPIIIMETLTKE